MAKLSTYIDILDHSNPTSKAGIYGMTLAALLKMTNNEWTWEFPLGPEERKRLEDVGQQIANPTLDFSHLKGKDRDAPRVAFGYPIEWSDSDAVKLNLFDRWNTVNRDRNKE